MPASLGARARRPPRRAASKAGARRRAGRRRDHQRGGLPAARLMREALGSRPPRRRAPAASCRPRRGARAGRARAAGHRPRPRVRPRRAAARLRADRRRADPRPAHAQGHPPPRRPARRRQRAPDRARPQRRRDRCATRPARRGVRWSRSTPRSAATPATLGGAADRRRHERAERPRRSPTLLRDAGEDVVIVYGERLRSARAAARRARCSTRRRASASRPRRRRPARDPARRQRPRAARGRLAPGHGPGYAPLADAAASSAGHRRALADGEITDASGCSTPTRSAPSRPRAVGAALGPRTTVIAVDTRSSPTRSREHADVVFPAEAYAEKEGTVTHPDGRLQRLRPAIGRPRPRRAAGSGVRAGWQVIADVAAGSALDLRVADGRAWRRSSSSTAVPFYAGHHARRDRRPRRPLARARGRRVAERRGEPAVRRSSVRRAAPTRQRRAAARHVPLALGRPGGRRLAALHFLAPRQHVELSPEDADALGIREGDRVEVADGTRVRAP